MTNYITAAGYGDNPEKFAEMWTNGTVNHVIGKDILRFHAIIWPAMLMSAGLKITDTVAAHGWWTVEGEKMSKSLGNVVNPSEEIKKYGLDPFRYYLMREATFGQDADYSKKAMVQRINSDLANDLGNLLNRTIGMQKKYFNSKVILNEEVNTFDIEIKELWAEVVKNVEIKMNDYQFSEVLKEIWRFISRMNKYIDECEPWKLAKDENSKDRLSTVMYNLVEALYKISVMISPFMPTTATKMAKQLGLNIDFDKLQLSNVLEWGAYPVGNVLNNAEPIFPRVEFIEEESKVEYNENLQIDNPISIDYFNKIKINVVEIEKVSKIEGADKLLKFIVNTGTEKRQIISGIAKFYQNEQELIGKKVMAILNLEPVVLRDELSQGMLLTTTEKKKTKLVIIDETVKTGTIIK